MLPPGHRNPEVLTSNTESTQQKSDPESDDGKRLRACEKRLELMSRAKPKRGGCWGERPARRGTVPDS